MHVVAVGLKALGLSLQVFLSGGRDYSQWFPNLGIYLRSRVQQKNKHDLIKHDYFGGHSLKCLGTLD